MRATHRTSDVDVSPNFRVPSSRRSFGTLSRSDGYPRRSRIAMRNAHRKWSRASLQLREGQTIGAVTIGPFPTFGLLHQRSSKVFETQKSKVKHGVFFALFFCVATAAVAFVGIKTASHMHMGASRARSVASSRISSFNTQATTSSLGSPQSTINVAVITEVDANQVVSHFGPPWEDVLLHIKRRLSWLDYDINLIAVSAEKVINDPKTVLHNIPMAIAIGIKNKAVAEKLARATSSVSTLVSYDSAPSLHAATRMNAHSLHSDSTWEVLKRIFRPKEFAELEKYRAAVNMATDLFERRTSDDFLFSFLVLINEAIRPIPDVTNSTKRQDAGVPELKCMIGHCSREIFACLADSTCRTALSCLNSCGFNDQVLD